MGNKSSRTGKPQGAGKRLAHVYPSPDGAAQEQEGSAQGPRDGQEARSAPQEEPEPQSDATQGDEPNQGVSGLPEWITFWIGLTIVMGTLLLMGYLHLTNEHGPPEFRINPLPNQASRLEAGYYLPIEVTNVGGQTAEEVSLKIILIPAEGSPEDQSYSIHFLSPRETDRSTIIFQNDPSQGTLEYTISFSDP